MRLRPLGFFATAVSTGAFAWAASATTELDPLQANFPSSPSISTSAAQNATRDARAAARTPLGPLPDPVLLDGSSQAPEKKSDYGMLGEFEIPGDEKGGASSDQKQQGGGDKQQSDKSQQSGGSQSQQSSQQQGGGGSQSQSSQQQGGGGQQGGQQGGGGSSDKADQSQGGGGGDQSADASQSGGGQQSGSKSGGGSKSASKRSGSSSRSSKGGGSGGSIAQDDANASADGAESSGLSAAQGGDLASQGDVPPKPGEMKIGDATMQIKTQTPSTAPSVVGVQQPPGKEVPQEYGRMAAGQPQSNTNVNKGVEKGQTMPTGL